MYPVASVRDGANHHGEIVEDGVRAAPSRSPNERAPAPAWLGRLGEPLYRAAVARRNRRFDSGARLAARLSVPVISIGNLSVGGTGKTPMVAHTVRLLYEHGLKPCVAMRGYASSAASREKKPELVMDEIRHERERAVRASDEADAYRRMFPDLPIVAQPDRLAGLRKLLESPFQPTIDCVVLDDGFQHRQIARTLDIVLIDASRPPMNDHLLPRGYLREPPGSLRRASCVVITHAELCEPGGGVESAESCGSFIELSGFIARHHGKPPIAITSHVWTALKRARAHAPEDDDTLPLDHLLGRRVVAACAIGNPRGFLTALRRTLHTDRTRPGTLAQVFELPDHDRFSEATAERIRDAAAAHDADMIVVTDKDWSKLRRYPSRFWPCPIVRPDLAVVFNSGQVAFETEVLAAVGGERPRAA